MGWHAWICCLGVTGGGFALAGQWLSRTKPLCLSEKLFPKCYCKDSGDENNDEKDDPIFTKFHFF